MGRYTPVVIETYLAQGEASETIVRARPVAGQGFDTGMHVECSKSMRYSYPVGTRFRIKATIKTREGGPPFLYTFHGWPFAVV